MNSNMNKNKRRMHPFLLHIRQYGLRRNNPIGVILTKYTNCKSHGSGKISFLKGSLENPAPIYFKLTAVLLLSMQCTSSGPWSVLTTVYVCMYMCSRYSSVRLSARILIRFAHHPSHVIFMQLCERFIV